MSFNCYFFSISAYKNHFGLLNLNEPISIDVTTPVQSWNEGKFQIDSMDAVVNMNMIHISPWETAVVSYNFTYVLVIAACNIVKCICSAVEILRSK